MGNKDAFFSGQIFRKDNPIVLACRRDQAVLMGVRLVYDGYDYNPGQCLVRYNSGANNGLFGRWSAASGGSYDSPCILFDQVTAPAFQAEFVNGVTGGITGSALAAAVMRGIVYTSVLTDYDSGFTTQLKSINTYDSNAVEMTRF